MATPAKLTDLDYIQFLLAAASAFSCVEAARTDHEAGLVVHLRGYGMIRVFVRLDPDQEEAQFWATSDLSMTEAKRKAVADEALAIEEYHRGIKQCCAVERCQARTERAQRNHLLLAIRAFVRLEWQRLETGRSWYESKKQIVREAIRAYRASPTLLLPTTA